MRRNAGSITLVTIGLFFGPALLGSVLSQWLAPESFAASVVGLFAMPLAFATCMMAWYGVAIVWLIHKLPAIVATVGRAIRENREAIRAIKENRPAIARDAIAMPIPGTWLFPPICTFCGTGAGTIIGLLPSALSFLYSLLCFATLGMAVGLLMRRAARGGWLVPPEEI